jgi:hypothetical protein
MSRFRRFGALCSLPLADALGGLSFGRERAADSSGEAMSAAARWLCRTHDVTGRTGSSKAFSLLHGWLPAYPETTGYVIGTLLQYRDRIGDPSLADRARAMGDWEIEVQNADGGVMENYVRTPPSRSIVFNTGMVIHGWIDLHARVGDCRYLEAGERAGNFLVRNQQADGRWGGEQEYAGIPHTYNSRVDWALLRLAEATGDGAYRRTAIRNLDWVLSAQRENGCFDSCIFKPGMLPSTHGLAYTMRGLLESAVLLEEDVYLRAAQKTAAALADVFERFGKLAATYDGTWTPGTRSECLTGTAQMSGVWLRLFQISGDRRLRDLGTAAVEQAASRQIRSGWSDVDGGLPGSFPVYGRYAPLQFPNWATKFLLDSLMLREDCAAPTDPAPAEADTHRPSRVQ